MTDAPSPSYLVRFIDVTTWILCVAMFITVLLFVLLWRGKEREILISCLGAIPGNSILMIIEEHS